MKFLHTAAYTLMASHAALAAPVTNSEMGLVEYRSANPEHMALATLEKRVDDINCQTLDRAVRAIGTSKFTLIYITLATTLTRSICGYVDGCDCSDLTLMIQTGFVLVYAAAAHYSGAQPEILPGAKKRGEDIHGAYLDWWIESLAASDLTYESITTLPFNTTEETLTRRDGDPALVSRVYLAGVIGAHAPSSKQDLIANHFADGNTLLHLLLPGSNSSTSELSKRIPAGSGLKISYVDSGIK